MSFLSTLLTLAPGVGGTTVDLVGGGRLLPPVDLLGGGRASPGVDLLGTRLGSVGGSLDLTPNYGGLSGFVYRRPPSPTAPAAKAPTTTPPPNTGGGGVANAANLAATFPQLQPYAPQLAEAVQASGVPPQVWMAAIMSESEGNPNAVNPRTLATGLLQNLPTESPAGRGRGYGYSSTQLQDPSTNLRIAHDEFRTAYAATAHITDPVERAVATIANAQRYEDYQNPQSEGSRRVRRFVQQAYAAAPTATAAATGGISQNELGLPPQLAEAFCGPAAVMWFTSKTGRAPTAVEAMNLGRELGVWHETQGMVTGPQGVVAMLQRLGHPAVLQAPNTARIGAAVLAGQPVLIDTSGNGRNNGHYFQVTAYDPQAGRFQFGDAVGRRYGWLGVDEMAQMGFGPARTAIHLGQ